jgi:hypothetical protein
MGFDKAKAETLWEKGSIEKHGNFTSEKIAERGGQWEEMKGFFQDWVAIKDWLFNLDENITKWSSDLLSHLYYLLTTFVLQTPLFMFTNEYIKNSTLTFSVISIMVVMILSSIEGIKRMVRKEHNDSVTIAKRFGVAVTISGFAPFIFSQIFNLLNMVTKAISKIGQSTLESKNPLQFVEASGLHTAALIGFDIALIALMIPVFLQNGRRWFDILCLTILTPLAMSSYVFDSYRHYYHKWLENIKRLSQVQLIYGLFICIMGIFIFATRSVVSPDWIIYKILFIGGGLWRMANPPLFIKSKIDSNGEDVIGMGKDFINTSKNIWNVATLKPTRLFMNKKKEAKAKLTAKLRKKHGQRFVKGLS